MTAKWINFAFLKSNVQTIVLFAYFIKNIFQNQSKESYSMDLYFFPPLLRTLRMCNNLSLRY